MSNDCWMNDGEVVRLAEFFKVFGDTTRIKILQYLLDSPRTVGEIVNYVGVSQSAVSHQLSILRKTGIVLSTRDGRSTRYTLNDEHIEQILTAGIDHIREIK